MRGALTSLLLLTACDVAPSDDPQTMDWVQPTDELSIVLPLDFPAPNPLGQAADWPGGRYAVTFDNDLGDTITAVLRLPEGVERVPMVTLLHGSGGLFKMPDDPSTFDPATGVMERSFREWDAMLAERGYGAFLPASFYSRGSFDYNDDPPEGMDKEIRLWTRVHDVVAAQRWVCGHPRVDCDRTATVGFSNGGSVLLLSQYRGLESHPDFPAIREPVGRQALGVAYYPGCGLHGFVGLSDGDYVPQTHVLMMHGDEDRLLENCETRFTQSRERGGSLEHTVYEDVGHGFDGDPHGTVEDLAQLDGRTVTMQRLHEEFR